MFSSLENFRWAIFRVTDAFFFSIQFTIKFIQGIFIPDLVIFQFNIHWLLFIIYTYWLRFPISYITFIHALFHILKDIYNRYFKILMC